MADINKINKLAKLIKEDTEKIASSAEAWKQFWYWAEGWKESFDSAGLKRLRVEFNKMWEYKPFTLDDIQLFSDGDEDEMNERFEKYPGYKEFQEIFEEYV